MPFPDRKKMSAPDASPDTDFFREALNQIHRDAQAVPENTAAKRAHGADIRSAVRSVARTIRPKDRAASASLPAAVTVAQQAPSAAPAPKQSKHTADQAAPVVDAPHRSEAASAPIPSAAPAHPNTAPTPSLSPVAAPPVPAPDKPAKLRTEKRFTGEPVPKSSVPRKPAARYAEDDASLRRAQRSQHNRTRAAARDAHKTDDAAPALPDTPSTASSPTRKHRRHSRKKHGRPARIILAVMLVFAVSLTALWIAFGYRSCTATALRFAEALYRADAESVFALYPEPVLENMIYKQKFTDRESFFAARSKSLRNKWSTLDTQVGPDWTTDITYTDKSEFYKKNLQQMVDEYAVDYGTRPAEARWLTLTVTIQGEDHELLHTRSVILMRFGTWWYVYDTPNLTF